LFSCGIFLWIEKNIQKNSHNYKSTVFSGGYLHKMRIKKLKYSAGYAEKMQDGEFIAKGGFGFTNRDPRNSIN
jgi:hypothetical protein